MYYKNINDFEQLSDVDGESGRDDVLFFSLVVLIALLIITTVTFTNG